MMPLGAQVAIFIVWWVLRFFVFLGDTRATFSSTPPVVGLSI